MERGPLALFGAIVAVGLGPAMWLGAQFAIIVAVPASGSPAAVSSPRTSSPAQEDGGGAGAATENPRIVIQPTDRGHDEPMRDVRRVSPSPQPSETSATPSATPTTATADASTEPSTPPAESTGTSSPPSASTNAPPSPPTSTTTRDEADRLTGHGKVLTV